jgi:hypothetical protein
MNRNELVRAAALLDIADDYESAEHVEQSLSGVTATCQVTFDRMDVLCALSELIKSGLAKAYLLSVVPPVEIAGVPSPEQFDDDYCYFYITTEGKAELARMRKGPWPFDDLGEFRPEFCPKR